MAKLMTRQEFVNQLIEKGRTDVILLGDYKNMATKTLFGCTKDGCKHEWIARPNKIAMGGGCPVCANKKLVRDINSVAVLRPDLVKYFVNPEDAYNVMPGSHKNVNLKCPDCGAIKKMVMYNLSFEGFSCTECSSYISYPNRLIRSVMNQFRAEIDYLEYEWSEWWTQRQRYDVYFEKNNRKYVIEMQGQQHYYAGGWKDKRTLNEIQEKDQFKQESAIEHNITPIVIDSRKSDFDFILESLKGSVLSNIFDFDVIDKQKCQNDITKNIVKQVCEQFDSDPIPSIKSLADNFCVSKPTIVKYLKMGAKIGWCDYTPGNLSETKVRVLDCNRVLIGCYNSIADCSRELSAAYNIKFYHSNISRACKNGYSCNGLFFEYA